MTRNWIDTVARTLGWARTESQHHRRQRRVATSLEFLEPRLSLSAVGHVAPMDLNPQPLPPGYAHVDPW
jgi:hypothetical protein